jgi:hypothetical protein
VKNEFLCKQILGSSSLDYSILIIRKRKTQKSIHDEGQYFDENFNLVFHLDFSIKNENSFYL